MMRTLVDIPEEDLERLAKATKQQGISRAEFVRRAIKASLQSRPAADLSKYFGIWADNPEDGQAFQDRMRAEWTRDEW
jgi:metal-responsive CopG/Arc/MetJ family transcriptional regulator